MQDIIHIIPSILGANNQMSFPDSDEDLALKVQDNEIVIFRGAYPAPEMTMLRREVLAWSSETAEFPKDVSASKPGINFHRIDDGTSYTKMPHIFHQFGFGDLSSLPQHLAAKLSTLGQALLNLQNRLAQTSFALDMPEIRIKVLQHPRGGGYLVSHTHPYLPQRVSLFLNLSEPGIDYQSGAARFLVNETWADTHNDFRIGDILAWRHDQIHDVTAVDPEAAISWANDDGLWILAVEMPAAYGKSKANEPHTQ
jgi:hypothetical protein